MTMKLTAVFEKVPEGYIAFVEELPGANTQGATVEEAQLNLQEAVELVPDANRVLSDEALNGRSVIREPGLSSFPSEASRCHPASGTERLRVSS